MAYRLSILICSLRDRGHLLQRLDINLNSQIERGNFKSKVQVLQDIDEGQKTIGKKRNDLIKRAKGDYICFIDDDDNVPEYYIEEIIIAIKTNPDCVGIQGIMTTDGDRNKVETFYHYLGNNYSTIGRRHYRYPNHLNPLRRDKVKHIFFPELNFGEDSRWAEQIMRSKLLRTSVDIHKVMYYYLYNSKK